MVIVLAKKSRRRKVKCHVFEIILNRQLLVKGAINMSNIESISFQRFLGRYNSLQQHSQIICVSLNKLYNQLQLNKNNEKTIAETLRLSADKYPKLNIPSTQYARVINFSKGENSDYCFLELYNLFSYYMRDILREMYQLHPKSITQKCDKTLTYSKLTEFSSIDELVDYMIDNIFKDLESLRSTTKLVKKIIGHTKIQIPQTLSDEALMYLNIRHLIIHNNSKVDKEFFEKYKNKLQISLNGKVPTDYQSFQKALEVIYNYIKTIDHQLILNNFINTR